MGVFAPGCGGKDLNGSIPDPNGGNTDPNNGSGNETGGDLLCLSNFEVLAKLDVYRATYEFEDDGDSNELVLFEIVIYFDGLEEIGGNVTSKLVANAKIDGEELEGLQFWITDDGKVVRVDFEGYRMEGADAQDWAEYEWLETEAMLICLIADGFSVDKLGKASSGLGWNVKSTSSDSKSFGGQNITVNNYEVEYSSPLEPMVVEWKIANFPGFKFISGLSAPNFFYTLKEITFR